MTTQPRIVSEFLAALANASRPYEAAQFEILPGDFKSIARLMALVEFVKTDAHAQADFQAFERRRKAEAAKVTQNG